METESLPFPIKPHHAHAIVVALSGIHGGQLWDFMLQQSGIFSLGFEAVRGKVPKPPSEFWHWCN